MRGRCKNRGFKTVLDDMLNHISEDGTNAIEVKT